MKNTSKKKKGLTVQELINKLLAVEDKDKEVNFEGEPVMDIISHYDNVSLSKEKDLKEKAGLPYVGRWARNNLSHINGD